MDTLLELRRRKRLSQAQVAQNLSIAQQYYSRIESGLAKPTPALGEKIAHFFGLSIEQMWTILYHPNQQGGETNAS